jgi:hypothetical protein
MKYIKMKLRSKFHDKYCNAIERGKCCYKSQSMDGLCLNHHQFFSLFFKDVAHLPPDTEIMLNYEINPVAKEGICKIIEKESSKKRITCQDPIHKKFYCQKHAQVLAMVEPLRTFLEHLSLHGY